MVKPVSRLYSDAVRGHIFKCVDAIRHLLCFAGFCVSLLLNFTNESFNWFLHFRGGLISRNSRSKIYVKITCYIVLIKCNHCYRFPHSKRFQKRSLLLHLNNDESWFFLRAFEKYLRLKNTKITLKHIAACWRRKVIRYLSEDKNRY